MNARPKSAIVLAFLSITALAPAEIDSGGGKSSGGSLATHSSIGGSFATLTTRGCPTVNQPGLIEVLYPVVPPSLADMDANGLPDGWEMLNFLHLGIDPDADADHDGTSNLMEYLAGTNPNSATCVFRPQGTYSSGIFQMPFPSVTGRNYKIWVTRDLKSWTLQSTITGDGSQKIFEFDETTITSGPLFSATHPSSYFFRVEIVMP